MAENSHISWTDHTFNPWIGCTKVSAGCAHCYADRDNEYYKWNPAGWGPKAPRKRTSAANWKKSLIWDRDRWLECPGCGWRGSYKAIPVALDGSFMCPTCKRMDLQPARQRIFCASLSDVFDDHPSIDAQWREDLWSLIEATPNLDWLLLTKRPEHVERFIPDRWTSYGYWDLHHFLPNTPPLPRNIWLGITAEDQDNFDARWPILAGLAARLCPSVLFVSAEPLLGSLDVSGWIDEVDEHDEDDHVYVPGIDWVIAGGESGPPARPTHPDWVRSLRQQCACAEVPFHFKQWGEWIARNQWVLSGRDLGDVPEKAYVNAKPIAGDQVYRVGRQLAGRLLDGKLHAAFPPNS